MKTVQGDDRRRRTEKAGLSTSLGKEGGGL